MSSSVVQCAQTHIQDNQNHQTTTKASRDQHPSYKDLTKNQISSPGHNCQVLFNASVYKTSSSFVRVETDHEVIVPCANLNLTSSRIRRFVPCTLAKCTRQIRDNGGADASCKLRRGRCICEEAENGGNLIAVRARTGGGLPDPPCRLGRGNAGYLVQKTGTGVGDVTLDCGGDAVFTVLFAGVSSSVV